MAAVCRRQPALLRALGLACPMTRCSPPPPAATSTRPHGIEKAARRMLDNPKARQALDEFAAPVAPLRPRPHRHQGAPRLPAVHPRYRHRHDPGGAPLRRRPGLERPQFHAALHRRLRLPEWRPRPHLRRRTAGQRFRPRGLSRQFRPRRPLRPGALPDPHRQARRDFAHRARPLRPRTVPLPARRRPASRRQHQSAARHRSHAR